MTRTTLLQRSRIVIYFLVFLSQYNGLKAAVCDTIPGHFFYRDTFCNNQLLLINGQFYGPDHPSGIDTLPGAAANGGDSIIHVDLTFFSATMALLDGSICSGDTIWVNNVPYHANFYLGEETIENGASNGCDSIIHIDLEVIPVPDSVLIDSLCPDEFRMINNKRYDRDNPSGIEILTGLAANGCDSIVQIGLLFREFCPSTEGFVYAPNVFSPGESEGPNARYYLSADAGVRQIQRMLIIDRWGDLVYLKENLPANDPDEGWDGKIRGEWAPGGVYAFRAEIELVDGRILVKTGDLALIR
ncbi:MAG: gliding motility-associated C-terminal domain-containing protein [Saprospiraceae bacterium]|nr:gliding motility-associated C-terminal domain-containing protein [Saprospiraceae bacterium]